MLCRFLMTRKGIFWRWKNDLCPLSLKKWVHSLIERNGGKWGKTSFSQGLLLECVFLLPGLSLLKNKPYLSAMKVVSHLSVVRIIYTCYINLLSIRKTLTPVRMILKNNTSVWLLYGLSVDSLWKFISVAEHRALFKTCAPSYFLHTPKDYIWKKKTYFSQELLLTK